MKINIFEAPLEIKFFKEDVDAVIPIKKRAQDAGIDLHSTKTVVIKAGERTLVPIGLRIILEDGYYYTFAPRSGLAFKSNIIPSHYNIMDSNYTGNCDVLMHNRSNEDYTIEKGDRFCQLMVHKVPITKLLEISKEEFDEIVDIKSERGDNGFGSSGK